MPAAKIADGRVLDFHRPFIEMDDMSQWLGFAERVENEELIFLWCRNIWAGANKLQKLSDAIGQQLGVRTRVGPAVDMSQAIGEGRIMKFFSSPSGGPAYALYVESGERKGFLFNAMISGKWCSYKLGKK